MAESTPSQQQLRRVLVTGGSGFLGTHIVQQLLADPLVHIAVTSRKPRAPTDDARISIHAADIASKPEVQAVFDAFKPQVVIHAASPHHGDEAAALRRTNIEGTKVLLECAAACRETHALVYTSSDSAVEPTQEPLTEDKARVYNEADHVTAYMMSKAVAEAAVQTANGERLRTAVLRLPVLYGDYDTSGAIPQMVTAVRKNEHKMQVGQNKKLFEFLYAGKAAEAHILAARALLDPEKVKGAAGEAFFISDGKPEPFFDFARRCYAAMGSPVAPNEVTAIPLAAMQIMASTVEWLYTIFTLGFVRSKLRREEINHLDRGCCWSIDKARERLGYEPIVDQDAAIKRSMDWAVANT
jgi:sterol-4alpha-carboxylate 3-dehydrogenase (decarboxylating)